LKPKREYKRGYSVAVTVGLDECQAVLWKVFSRVVKHEKTFELEGARSDQKTLYNFHESIINALRPAMKEGVRSFIIVSPSRANYTQRLREHIRAHHAWLTQGPSRAVFSEMTGSAVTLADVAALTRSSAFRKIIDETTAEETADLLELLEKRLNTPCSDSLVLYSLGEIEDEILSSWVASKPKPEFLLLTDAYLSTARQRSRLQRLMQIASNKSVKTRILKADSPAGKRLAQLGGIVCVMKQD
jgi:stalled ribosome rescue protein Dom34